MKNKTVIRILILSAVTVFVWIGYVIYSNLVIVDYTKEQNLGPYVNTISTNLFVKDLTDLNQKSGNIKITNASLGATASVTPTPTSSTTP